MKAPLFVTDSGLKKAPMLAAAVDAVRAAGLNPAVFADVRGNPTESNVNAGIAAFKSGGHDGMIAFGGGSGLDAGKAIAFMAVQERPIWDFEDVGDNWKRGRTQGLAPTIAVPTTAGTGSEAHPFAVITHDEIGRKDYIGHRSLLPFATILDPALTVGLPAGVTAATGVDALTHSLESLLSRNANPFAESMAVGVIRTVHEWLPRAVADGSDIEARSQMLLAAHLAGVGQASGTGVGLVHALGHALGTRGRLPHGTALAVVLPEVLGFYATEEGLRDRELALVGVALRAASPTEQAATAAGAAIGELRRFLASLGQRHSLRSLGFDERALDVVAQDAVDDAAIRNSPRLPSLDEARGLLASVLD
jgi:alcohol dehydrogenase class IV